MIKFKFFILKSLESHKFNAEFSLFHSFLNVDIQIHSSDQAAFSNTIAAYYFTITRILRKCVFFENEQNKKKLAGSCLCYLVRCRSDTFVIRMWAEVRRICSKLSIFFLFGKLKVNNWLRILLDFFMFIMKIEIILWE